MARVFYFPQPDLPPRPTVDDMQAFLRFHGEDAVWDYIKAQALDCQDGLADLLVSACTALRSAAARADGPGEVVRLAERRGPAR